MSTWHGTLTPHYIILHNPYTSTTNHRTHTTAIHYMYMHAHIILMNTTPTSDGGLSESGYFLSSSKCGLPTGNQISMDGPNHTGGKLEFHIIVTDT